MNGLQSLMQGMPQGQQGMPQGQQGTPMPNDPRMGAAMGLVDDSIEKFNLDPQTEALMLQNQALALLQAADNVGKMSAPQQDTNIKEQTTQGIAGMLQSLAPGMQQRGQQMQQAQARPPMGGMPSMGAPNMARMANGGIVGFDGGGFLNKAKEWDTKLNQAHDRRQTERLARGKSLSDYSPLDPYNSLSNIMYDTGIAGAMQGLTGYKSEVQQPEGQLRGDLDPVAAFLETYKQLQADVERSFPEEKAAFKQRVIDFVNNSDPRVREAAIGSRAGMARGGIIGYAGPEGSQVQGGGRAAQQRRAAAAYAARKNEASENQSIVAAKNNRYIALLSEGVPAGEARAIVEAEALAASGERIPFEMRPNSARDVGNVANIGGITGLLAKAGQKEPPFRMQGMEEATPTVGTPYDPTGTESASLLSGVSQDTFVPRVGALATAPVAPQEFTPDALDLLTEEKLEAALNADPNEVATTRGDRLRELTGFDDLMARRIESEKAVRAQKESRLSPEETRKRRIQAGLARLAEQGLGGFGAGRTAEMDKIAAERLGIEETSLADLNSLIAEKRAMGMTLFEAENSARAEIQGSQDNAATAAGRRADTRRTADAAAERDRRNIEATATQGGLNRANQLAIAEIQTSGSQFGRSLGIRIKALRDELGFDVSQTEIENQALQSLVDDSLRSDLARLGVQENDQNRKIINDSIEAATKMLTGNIANMTKDPTQLQDEIFTLAEKIRNVVYGSTPSTGGSSTGPAVGTESGGFRFKGGDPADRNNWQEI